MATVVATHAVGDMETWLAGGEDRQELFKTFSSSYRIFRHADRDEVSLVWEGVDLEKMRAAMKKEEERLANFHKYEDGTVDQPFLTPDTVKD